jgi:hypothetical protein
MKFNSTFFENKSKENLIKYFILGKANERILLFGDNPINSISLLHDQGKEIFKESISYENNNSFPIKLNEIFFEMKNKSKKLMNLPSIENINGDGINFDKIKTSKTSKNKKTIISLKEESNKAFFKDNEDLKKNNFNNYDDCNGNGFTCNICGLSFNNGQGLGGHMSRKHPNQSEKYQKKKLTRERRNNNREIIYRAKRILLKRFKQDYDHLINFSNGRRIIKKLVRENRDEYLTIKGKIKTRNEI